MRDIRCPPQLDKLKTSGGGVSWNMQVCLRRSYRAAMACLHNKEDEEGEEFITSGNWRGKHNSLSRGAGADQP